MNALVLPRVERRQWLLQQQLSTRQQHFTLAQGHANLSIEAPCTALDRRLSLHWQGQLLHLTCQGALLVRWLAPQLQEAAFDSLPPALKLAVLEAANTLPGLVWQDIQTVEIAAQAVPGLCITLVHGGEQLKLWLESGADEVLANLPRRTLKEQTNVPLSLSLQWGPVALTPAELLSLRLGDLLLLPPGHETRSPLLGLVEARPWGLFHPSDRQLEFIAMHSTPQPPLADPVSDLEQLPVQVTFEVGRQTVDLHQLATLQPGTLLDLACPLNGEVRILVNQQCLGTGELVNIEDRLGVRVVRLLKASAP